MGEHFVYDALLGSSGFLGDVLGSSGRGRVSGLGRRVSDLGLRVSG